MNPDLLADLDYIRQRDEIRRRDMSGRVRNDTSFLGRPVIAVGDFAAYESAEQAGRITGVSGQRILGAVNKEVIKAGGRPWMLATPPLLRAINCGGWVEACRLGLVDPSYYWAIRLGRMRRWPKRKVYRNVMARRSKAA